MPLPVSVPGLVLVEVNVVQGLVGLQRLEVDLVAQDAYNPTNHPTVLDFRAQPPNPKAEWADLIFLVTSDATESSDELRTFLRLVRDDFQGGTKTLVVVCQPLQQRLALDQLQLVSSLNKKLNG